MSGRLRLAEREPGVAAIAFGLGVVWGGVWILSAMFNSVAILMSAEYGGSGRGAVRGHSRERDADDSDATGRLCANPRRGVCTSHALRRLFEDLRQ